jgi:N-acetylmuramoyl-L-alanine amidase
MRAIHKIIIHCTATREGDNISVDTIRRWHLNRGWSDIGYHYVIDIKGNINAGRPIELMGSHTRGENKYSIGVAYVGGVEADGVTPKDTRTKAQKDAIIRLVKKLKGCYPDVSIHGHNEFSNKACPSYNVQNEKDLFG